MIPRRYKFYPHVGAHNWLIHGILIEFIQEAAKKDASGTLVDIGCGHKPYKNIFSHFVSKHIGIDHADTYHGLQSVDIVGDDYDTGLADEFADVVLSTEVFEHLEEPASHTRN